MPRDPSGVPRNTFMLDGVETDAYGRDLNRITPRTRTQRKPKPISDLMISSPRPQHKTQNNSSASASASVAMGTALTLALIGSAKLLSKHERLTTMNNLKEESRTLKDEKDKVVRIKTHLEKMPGLPGGAFLPRGKSVELEKLTTRVFGDDAPSVLRRLSKPSYRRDSPELDVIEEGGDGSVYTKDEVDHVLKTLNVNREINKQQKRNLQSATRHNKKAQKFSNKLAPHRKYRHQQFQRGRNRNTRRTSR